MGNLFYRWAIDSKTVEMDEKIDRAISIIEKYELYNEKPEAQLSTEEPTFFKRVTEDWEVVNDLFVDNLHIHVSLSETQKIYSVRIKKDEDAWTLQKKDNTYDASHPTNVTYEVYIKYDIPVLDITRASGTVYKHGTWDKYVSKTMSSFFTALKDYTISSKFNEGYKKVKTKKNYFKKFYTR